ncbi:MAG: hypothetical protein ACI4DP_01175 [Candidatus Ornithomonoglobus sp.]
MQNTLTAQHNGKTVVSKEFDFEAMCLIDDHLGTNEGVLHATKDAVSYMFRETVLTEDAIEKLPFKERRRLCHEAWKIYLDTVKN